MNLQDIKTIAIAGAGTMGQGIAQMCAMTGHKTIIYDINSDMLSVAEKNITKNLDKGIERGKVTEDLKSSTLANISYTTKIEDLVCDVAIEAVIEKLEVKHSLFSQLEEINSDKCILATNTSSIPITQIARPLKRPGNVVGMHFFNPAHIMKLVEVISGAATKPEIAQLIYDLAVKLGKKPVMAADSPGFIVNRVARHFYVEGLKVAEERIADFETIDKLIESSGFRMGPYRLMDLIGVDTNFSVTSSMFESFKYDSKFRPSKVQEMKVLAGHNGRKSGKGFYDYSEK